MSQNVIRGVFSQQASVASKLFSKLGDISLQNNQRTHFKDHILDHSYVSAVTQVIQNNPGFSVPEISFEAAKLLGLDTTSQKDLTKVSIFTSRFLAETSVGHTLASNGFVGLTPMGRMPRWFAALSVSAQALVPRRTYADNASRFGFVTDASVPVALGSTFIGFRSDYLAPSGFGKRRWLSQISLQAISRTDTGYGRFVKLDAKVRADSAEAQADLAKAINDRATARTDLEEVKASIRAMEANQRMANADMVATVIRAITETVPDESLDITSVKAADAVPPAATVAPRRRAARPRKPPIA